MDKNQQTNWQQAQVNSLESTRVQLADEWPSLDGETHKHSSNNIGEPSDSCKFFGQGPQFTPVLPTWVYCATVATIITPSDSVHISGQGERRVYMKEPWSSVINVKGLTCEDKRWCYFTSRRGCHKKLDPFWNGSGGSNFIYKNRPSGSNLSEFCWYNWTPTDI